MSLIAAAEPSDDRGINDFEKGIRTQTRRGTIEEVRQVFALPMFQTISARLHARSTALLTSLENRLSHIVIGWMLLAALACAARVAASSLPVLDRTAITPYLLLVLAPAASFVLALRWFADGESLPQPERRLALVGRWQSVSADEAKRHPLFGTSGIMVSLLVGMLLNVPVRAAEYLASIPAIAADAPQWLSTLHFAMTVDAVLMSSLYVVAFVAALRRVPLFPRLLLFIWLTDITMQLLIANAVVATDVPGDVASALHALLEGNIKKTMISVGLWLPYLLMSKRVNVTYRHRLAV